MSTEPTWAERKLPKNPERILALLGEPGAEEYIQFAFHPPAEVGEGEIPHLEARTTRQEYKLCTPPGLWSPVERGVRLDGAVLPVPASEKIPAMLGQQLAAARRLGAPCVASFLDIGGAGDLELEAERERELRELLREHGFPEEETRIIRGRAGEDATQEERCTSGERLLEVLDELLPPIGALEKQSFLFRVEETFQFPEPSGEPIALGHVEQSWVARGDTVKLFSAREARLAQVTKIQVFKRELDYAEEGDNVGLCLQGLSREELQQYPLLGAPEVRLPKASSRFRAELGLMLLERHGAPVPPAPGIFQISQIFKARRQPGEEGWSHPPLPAGSQLELWWVGTKNRTEAELGSDLERTPVAGTAPAEIFLPEKTLLLDRAEFYFSLRGERSWFGFGVVLEALE